MAEVDRGMEVADMKRLLVKSKVEPVNVAVGLDGKNAVMMLHKVKQPKAVSKDLEGKFKGLKNPRWGTAFVDTDADAKLVILTLNRSASGMGQKLKKTLKGTGFSKVRIQLEDGTVDEDVGEEDEESEAEGEGGGQNDQQPEPVAAQGPSEQNEQPEQTQNDTQQPEPVVAQGPNQENEQQENQNEQQTNWQAELTQQLAGQVKQLKQVLQTSPERGNELKALAAAAQTAVKGTDEQAARAALDALTNAMTNGPQQGGGEQTGNDAQQTNDTAQDGGQQNDAPNGGPKNPAVLQKSRLAWVAARRRIEDEIGKLHDAMSKHYDGHGFGADLDKVFQSKVEPILTTLDQSLADKLDEMGKNNDANQHEKLAGEAKQIIDRYESFVSSNNLISQLDQNPFVPLQIQKTLTATLGALKKSVR